MSFIAIRIEDTLLILHNWQITMKACRTKPLTLTMFQTFLRIFDDDFNVFRFVNWKHETITKTMKEQTMAMMPITSILKLLKALSVIGNNPKTFKKLKKGFVLLKIFFVFIVVWKRQPLQANEYKRMTIQLKNCVKLCHAIKNLQFKKTINNVLMHPVSFIVQIVVNSLRLCNLSHFGVSNWQVMTKYVTVVENTFKTKKIIIGAKVKKF